MSHETGKFAPGDWSDIQSATTLPNKIPDTAEGRAFFASLTDEQRKLYRPSVGDARTVLPGQPVRYHAATPSGSGSPPSAPPRGLRFADAATIKLALNAALLKPDLERASRLLTDDQRARLETAIDAATVRPAECGHGDWEWPMQRCPTCGADDIGKGLPR